LFGKEKEKDDSKCDDKRMVSIGQMFLMLKCGENVFPCAKK
jgi:hypothetical protein